MDWPRAISINKEALARIVAGMVALLAAQGGALRLPRGVYQLLSRLLFPAESAVRRLIVVVARGLVVADVPSRPMPKGLVIARKGGVRVSFQLFDTRKTFDDPAEAPVVPSGPRIRVIDTLSPRQMFLAKFAKHRDDRCSEAETLRISQRVTVLARALEHLSREAKRMARWQKRRARLQNPAFVFPLRPGPPPGHQPSASEDIDHVLRECHALAWMVLSPDTS